MRKLLILLSGFSSVLHGYTAHLINGTNTYLNFYIKTSLLGCGCNGGDCSPEVVWNVAPSTTEDYSFSKACKGACITSITVKEGNCTLKEGAVKGFAESEKLGNWTIEGGPAGQPVKYGDVILLKSHGIYVGVDGNKPNNPLGFDRTQAGDWEHWIIQKPGDEKSTNVVQTTDNIVLKNYQFKKYLSADENKRDVTADRDTAGPWETWTLSTVGFTQTKPLTYGSNITLRSPHGGKKPYFSYWGLYPDCTGEKQTFGTADFGAGACEDVDVIVYQKLREIPKFGFAAIPKGWEVLSAQGQTVNVNYGDRISLVVGDKFLRVNGSQVVLDGTKITPETSWTILSAKNPSDTGIVHGSDTIFLTPVVGSGYLTFVENSQLPIIVPSIAPGTEQTWRLENPLGVGAPLNKAGKINLKTTQKTAQPYFSAWIEYEPYIVVDKRGGGDIGHIIAHGFEDWGRAMKIDQLRKFPGIMQKSFEIAGLEVKLGVLMAAKESSAGFMEGMRKGAGGLLRGLPEIVKTLQIRKVEFEGSAKDMVNGVFPHGSMEIMLLGKTYEVTNVKFDPLGAYNSLKQAINEVATAVQQEWNNVIAISNKVRSSL